MSLSKVSKCRPVWQAAVSSKCVMFLSSSGHLAACIFTVLTPYWELNASVLKQNAKATLLSLTMHRDMALIGQPQ